MDGNSNIDNSFLKKAQRDEEPEAKFSLGGLSGLSFSAVALPTPVSCLLLQYKAVPLPYCTFAYTLIARNN